MGTQKEKKVILSREIAQNFVLYYQTPEGYFLNLDGDVLGPYSNHLESTEALIGVLMCHKKSFYLYQADIQGVIKKAEYNFSKNNNINVS
jgi:hypothetical protein